MSARKRRRKKRTDQRGVALLLVLSSIALMTITVVDFQEEQTADLHSAFAERDALTAEYMAKSAENLARLWIAAEPLMRQSLGILKLLFGGRAVPQLPVWEFSDQVLGVFSGDKDGREGFGRIGGFDVNGAKNIEGPEGATFKVVVVDEDSKINLNLGARGQIIAENRFGGSFMGLTGSPAFDPLFQKNDRDGNTSPREAICGALMDWADPDENLYTCEPHKFQGGGSGGGAGEDTSSMMLPRPYRVKNAPFDSLEEARLVRGMGDDFWATFIDPDPTNPKKRVMTVWGQGPINVNTAPPQAVFGVVCGLAPTAELCSDIGKQQMFLTMFGVLRNFTSGMPLFGTPQEFVNTVQGGGMYGKMLFGTLGIPPFKFQSPAEAAKSFTTESKIFSIYATGEVKGYKRVTKVRIHTVVDFRNVPPIPNGALPLPGQPGAPGGGITAGQPPPGQQPGAPVGAIGGTGATGSDAILGAINPNPGGTVVYHRIE